MARRVVKVRRERPLFRALLSTAAPRRALFESPRGPHSPHSLFRLLSAFEILVTMIERGRENDDFPPVK